MRLCLIALFICAVALLVYYLWPYNRNWEMRKLYGIILGSALGFAVIGLYIAINVPNEITRGGYRFLYIVNYTLSSTVLLYLLFILSSLFRSSKMYFARSLVLINKLK